MRARVAVATALVLALAVCASLTFSCSSKSCTVDSDDNCDDPCASGNCSECVCAGGDYACIQRCAVHDASIDRTAAPFDAGPLPEAAMYSVEAGALRVSSTSIYWIDYSGNIFAAPKDGSGTPTIVSSEPSQGMFALGSAGIYYLRADGRVGVIPYDAGAESTVKYPPAFPNAELPVGNLLIDDASLYYMSPSTDVVRAPLDGGTWLPSSVPYDAGPFPQGGGVIAQNDHEIFVYVVAPNDSSYDLFTLDKTSGVVDDIATLHFGYGFGADDSYVYVDGLFAGDGGILRIADDGGSSLWATPAGGPFAVDTSALYGVGLAPDSSTNYYNAVPAIARIDKGDGGIAIVAVLWEDSLVADLQIDEAYVYVAVNDAYGREFIARFVKTP